MVGHYGTLLPVANMVRGGACRRVSAKSDGFKSATISVVSTPTPTPPLTIFATSGLNRRCVTCNMPN